MDISGYNSCFSGVCFSLQLKKTRLRIQLHSISPDVYLKLAEHSRSSTKYELDGIHWKWEAAAKKADNKTEMEQK